ncbi:hypothetical protein CW304_02380 [Bacillus sp. UFRGS-B20]|nr:hypothetical protein CW304_02380 [Bacillus sp. UFRGS-B20]
MTFHGCLFRSVFKNFRPAAEATSSNIYIFHFFDDQLSFKISFLSFLRFRIRTFYLIYHPLF